MNKKIIILTTLAIIAVSISYAQIPPPGGPLPPDGVPIDGGLGLLLAGLIGYAYKKFKK